MKNFKGVVEPVLVLFLCVGLVRGEGSGGFDSEHEGLLADLEGLDDGEGSGEFDYLSPIEEKTGPSLDLEYKVLKEDLEYYDDVYPNYEDFLNNYENGAEEEYKSIDVVEVDSVFGNPASDIEIRPKPGSEDDVEVTLETSQIFIMVGSAFVSFAIVMLTFFLCRRMMARKEEKKRRIPYAISPQKRAAAESSIVKDYQKVPTSTKEFLQKPRIEMYREDGTGEQPAAAPLVP